MTGTIERDPVERVAAYRPSRAGLAREWAPQDVRDRILAAPPGGRLAWRPVHGRRLVDASVLTAAAIVALMVGVLLVVVRSPHAARHDAGGGTLPAATADTPTVGDGQYARRAVVTYRIADDGSATEIGHGTVWSAPDGSLWMDGDLSAAGCIHVPAPDHPDFQSPTKDFFGQLPTSPGALESYLRAHVSGSSSQDEALFVAVGDMLRNTDLLASAELRAAAASVLGGISGITVHTDATDYLGRPAVRVDWVNQALRPGEASSLYFDPATYQLVEERSGPSGAPSSYDGPSPAYTAHESEPDPTQNDLANPAGLSVMTAEDVVDSVPDDVRACRTI